MELISYFLTISASLTIPTLTRGIKFPGPCPDLQPSLSDFGEFTRHNTLLLLPFSLSSNSLFFSDWQFPNQKVCTEIRYNVSTIRLLRDDQMLEVEGRVQIAREDDNHLWLYSIVKSLDSNPVPYCIPGIIEKIRIWSTKEIKLMWSCRDAESGLNHDAAVIVTGQFGIKWTSLVEFTREAVELYLPMGYLEHISWQRKEGGMCSGKRRDLTGCAVEEESTNIPVKYFTIVVIILLIFICFVLWRGIIND